jgi:hypothetical protein
MGQHAHIVAEKMRTELAHAPVGGEVFVLDRARLAREPISDIRLRFARERFGIRALALPARTGHAIERPHEIHRRRPRGAKFSECLVEVSRILPRRKHDAPSGGDADRGRAAHGKIADRNGDVAGTAAVDIGFLERQAALVEQAQMIALPDNGADRIVLGMSIRTHGRSVRYALGSASAHATWEVGRFIGRRG